MASDLVVLEYGGRLHTKNAVFGKSKTCRSPYIHSSTFFHLARSLHNISRGLGGASKTCSPGHFISGLLLWFFEWGHVGLVMFHGRWQRMVCLNTLPPWLRPIFSTTSNDTSAVVQQIFLHFAVCTVCTVFGRRNSGVRVVVVFCECPL